MYIGVTNAAVQDLDEDVVIADGSPVEFKRCERTSFVLDGVGFGWKHEIS